MYEKTKMQNIMIHIIKQMKWRWAGHIMRMAGERWTKKITEWCPINKTRNRGRPTRRWRDDLKLKIRLIKLNRCTIKFKNILLKHAR